MHFCTYLAVSMWPLWVLCLTYAQPASSSWWPWPGVSLKFVSKGFSKCWWDIGWRLLGGREQRYPWVSDNGVPAVFQSTLLVRWLCYLPPKQYGDAASPIALVFPQRQASMCPGCQPSAFCLLPGSYRTGQQGAPCGCLGKLGPQRKWLDSVRS